jgi:hypothetical protein
MEATIEQPLTLISKSSYKESRVAVRIAGAAERSDQVGSG